MFKKAVTLIDAFEDFITSREAMLDSPGTIRFYKLTAKSFVEWLNLESPEEITLKHIGKYFSELREKDLSDSDIHGHARAVITLLRFFYDEGYISKSIRIVMTKISKTRLPIPSLEEKK